MHFLNSYLLFLIVFLLKVATLSGQVIDIGNAVRKGERTLSIMVESRSAAVATIARSAFALHGGYVIVESGSAAFTLKIEPIDSVSVTLSVLSGTPSQELYRRKVSGQDLQGAVLRACDIAVEATLRTKGFFAGKLAFVGKQQGVSEIYVSDLLFNKTKPLTADRAHVVSPDWSPDGTKLVYTTYFKSGFPDIYMIDVVSGRRIPIATFGGTNSSPAISPDGLQIAMSLSGKGNSEIFVTDMNGKRPRPITRNRSMETSPSWSPDGRWLVVESDMPGKPQLYEVPVSGESMRRLPTNISGYCSEPTWNPVDKDLIAFTAAVRGGFQIAVYDRSAEKSELLTSVLGSAVEPEWLSDGRHLVFTQKKNGTKRLMILDSRTKKISALHKSSVGEASSAAFVY